MAMKARPACLAVVMVLPFLAWNQPQSSSPVTESEKAAQAGSAPSAGSAVAPGANPAPQATPEAVYPTATVLKAVTRLVIVDVVASDKKGQPAKDLKLSDFMVQEDGRLQTIKVFNFQQPAVDAPGAAPAATKLPENIFSNIPSYKPNSALNVVLLDALNTTAQNQAYVRAQMIHYLEKMPEGRPVAVYTL